MNNDKILNLITLSKFEQSTGATVLNEVTPETSQNNQPCLFSDSIATSDNEKAQESIQQMELVKQGDLFDDQSDCETISELNNREPSKYKSLKTNKNIIVDEVEQIKSTDVEIVLNENKTGISAENKFTLSNIHTVNFIDLFYQKLCLLIKQTPNSLIDKTELDKHFPEFELISKRALEQWLTHLVDEGKLVRTPARKKQYSLPDVHQ